MRCVTDDAEQKEQSTMTATRTSLPGLTVGERDTREHVQSDALDVKFKKQASQIHGERRQNGGYFHNRVGWGVTGKGQEGTF